MRPPSSPLGFSRGERSELSGGQPPNGKIGKLTNLKHPGQGRDGRLSGGSGWGFVKLPLPGQQLVQSGGGMVGDTGQHVGKPSLPIGPFAPRT
jgi:hypothetical protein